MLCVFYPKKFYEENEFINKKYPIIFQKKTILVESYFDDARKVQTHKTFKSFLSISFGIYFNFPKKSLST